MGGSQDDLTPFTCYMCVLYCRYIVENFKGLPPSVLILSEDFIRTLKFIRQLDHVITTYKQYINIKIVGRNCMGRNWHGPILTDLVMGRNDQ